LIFCDLKESPHLQQECCFQCDDYVVEWEGEEFLCGYYSKRPPYLNPCSALKGCPKCGFDCDYYCIGCGL